MEEILNTCEGIGQRVDIKGECLLTLRGTYIFIHAAQGKDFNIWKISEPSFISHDKTALIKNFSIIQSFLIQKKRTLYYWETPVKLHCPS